MCTREIWLDVDELAFHENAILLEALARSQAKQLHPERRNRSELAWARDFLDDFALIAAGPGEASNVAAACLELSQDEDTSVTIRVAKNEDFDCGGRQRLSQVVEVMNQVRQESLSVSGGEERCFELIVQGCRARIVKQITDPTGLWSLVRQPSTTYVDLLSKAALSHRAQHSESRADIETIGAYSSRTHEAFMQLAASRWTKMVELINQVKISPDPEAIKRLARLAYDVRRSDSFRVLLEALFRQPRHHASKIMERVGKIAKFFRSAVTVAQVAAGASLGSRHIKVELVPSISRSIDVLRPRKVADRVKRAPALSGKHASRAVEVQRLLQRWRRYIVHAEMLLLIFYEEHPEITLATNYIGISKRSCYLCANFIRMHDVFAVEGQHQQLYCLWTLPEKVKFGSQTRSARFLKALTDLEHLLQNRVAAISLPSYQPLIFLKESVANFSRATMIARAESLEKLNKVNIKAQKCIDSYVSVPVLVEEEADGRKILKSVLSHVELRHQDGLEKIGIGTLHEKVNQEDGSVAGASSPPPDMILECQLRPKEEISETTQVLPPKAALIIENQASEDCRAKFSQAGSRRRRPRARPNTTSGGVSRRTVSRAAIPQQPPRSARRRKGRHVRSRNIKGRIPRSPVPTRRHLKKVSHKGRNAIDISCSSLLTSFLKSLRKLMFMAFGRHRFQTKFRRK